MDFKKICESKVFIIFFIIGELIILLLSFEAGILIGSKRADFSCNMDKNYERNFGGPNAPNNWMDNPGGAHGIFGQIIKIEDSSIIIKDVNSTEKIISIKEDALIKKFKDTIKLSDLKINDKIVVIGDSNDNGEIEAKFIRLMPSPSGGENNPDINNDTK